ncbi:hypothetical protein [uncultured Clostridium sp.]|uniref:hypothetical protein n=1 Tax=uncultured Clostridium sp. TaxID=59620 RepID=UPI00262C767B|nr:hypothetical protein [uncultured Clostridium sp.]
MRVNLNLNESNSKDKKIINFLESKYNSSAYIKEVLYQLATGGFHGIGDTVANTSLDNSSGIPADIHPIKEETEEAFDEILGVDGIEL